jgi:hypothetical protein
MSEGQFRPLRRFACALAIGVAATSVSMFAPSHVGAASPACKYAWYESGPDAPAPIFQGVVMNQQTNNLDIIEGAFGLTPDGTQLRAVLYLISQDYSFLTGAVGIDYQMVFTYGTNAGGQPVVWATDASLSLVPSNPPTQAFSYGFFQGLGTATTGNLFTQYAQQGLVTGQFTTSPATVEVDVPLSKLTTPGGTPPPTIGSILTGTQALSATGQGAQSQGQEYISDYDPASATAGSAFGKDYTVGESTCVSPATVGPGPGGVPEAPFVGLLAVIGATTAGVIRLRRRRASTK